MNTLASQFLKMRCLLLDENAKHIEIHHLRNRDKISSMHHLFWHLVANYHEASSPVQ